MTPAVSLVCGCGAPAETEQLGWGWCLACYRKLVEALPDVAYTSDVSPTYGFGRHFFSAPGFSFACDRRQRVTGVREEDGVVT